MSTPNNPRILIRVRPCHTMREQIEKLDPVTKALYLDITDDFNIDFNRCGYVYELVKQNRGLLAITMSAYYRHDIVELQGSLNFVEYLYSTQGKNRLKALMIERFPDIIYPCVTEPISSPPPLPKVKTELRLITNPNELKQHIEDFDKNHPQLKASSTRLPLSPPY
jgi:hypothetical protein